MIPVSIGVMHVPEVFERKVWLQQQIDALGGLPEIRSRVRSYKIIRDQLRGESSRARSPYKAALRAWRSFEPDATHILQLNDDMLPTGGFLNALEQVITAVPDKPVVLFSMRTTQQWVLDRGEHWWHGQDGMWGGAILFPVPMMQHAIEWIETHIPEEYKHDDSRLGMYCVEHGIDIWFTAPSLLEHVGAATSMLGNANKRRVANVFLPDVSHIDFSVLPEKPYFARGHNLKQEMANWVRRKDVTT